MVYFVPSQGSLIITLPASSRPSTTTKCPILAPVSLNTAAHEPVVFNTSNTCKSVAPGMLIGPPCQRTELSGTDKLIKRYRGVLAVKNPTEFANNATLEAKEKENG